MTETKPKPRNQMTKRERLHAYTDEVNYALNLLKSRMENLAEKVKVGTAATRVYVVLTTPELERKVFTSHAGQWLKSVRVVAGRSSALDVTPPDKRRVTLISDLIGDWIYVRSEVEEILEWFTILIDVKTQIETPRGKHGLYCRLNLTKESIVRSTIEQITKKYKVNGELT